MTHINHILPVSTEFAGPSKGVGVNVHWPAIGCCSKLHTVGSFIQLGLQIISLWRVKGTGWKMICYLLNITSQLLVFAVTFMIHRPQCLPWAKTGCGWLRHLDLYFAQPYPAPDAAKPNQLLYHWEPGLCPAKQTLISNHSHIFRLPYLF